MTSLRYSSKIKFVKTQVHKNKNLRLDLISAADLNPFLGLHIQILTRNKDWIAKIFLGLEISVRSIELHFAVVIN